MFECLSVNFPNFFCGNCHQTITAVNAVLTLG